jgi:hypothetical protein
MAKKQKKVACTELEAISAILEGAGRQILNEDLANNAMQSRGMYGPFQRIRPEGTLGTFTTNTLRHQRTIFQGKLWIIKDAINRIPQSDNDTLTAIDRVLNETIIPALDEYDAAVFRTLMAEVRNKVHAVGIEE